MEIQCSSCGMQTRSGAKFCHACGTPIATTSLPPTMPIGTAEADPRSQAPSYAPPTTAQTTRNAPPTETMKATTSYMPQPPQPYQSAFPPMPVGTQKKSNSGLKVMLITFGILIFLGIASVVGAVYFVSKKASQAVAELKKNGPISINTDPEALPDDKLGVPIYPDAKRVKTVSGAFGGLSGSVVEFTTDDEMEEVADFYRDHFRDNNKERLNEVINNRGRDRSVVFEVDTETGKRIITITPNRERRNDDARTKIVILGGDDFSAPPPPPPPPPEGHSEEVQKAREQALKAREQALKDAQRVKEQALKEAQRALESIEKAAPTKR